MITWFQRTFGKHHKWVLVIMLVLMLVSTVIGIGAVPRGSLTARHSTKRLYLGLDLNNQQQLDNVRGALDFTYNQLNEEPLSSEQALQAAFDQRAALMKLADDWNIPQPTTKQLEDYIHTVRAFSDSSGNFSKEAYLAFREKLMQHTPAERDFAVATLNENARLERVREILGGPGYVLPFLAQSQVGMEKMKFNLDAATLDYAKFEPKIADPKDSDLQAFFEKAPDRFQRPAQARLSYVKFPAAASSEPTAAQLSDYATAHKELFPDLKPGAWSDKDKTAVTDAWRAQQKGQGMKDAGAAAMKFARELYELKVARNTPAFDALLKKYNLTLQSLPPIEQGKPVPADSPITDDVLQQVAFMLNAQQTFSPPVPMTDGAAILFLDEAVPARTPTFAEARADVATSYREGQKEMQFKVHGDEIRAAITKAMGEGKTFAEAAAAQGMSVKNYADITDDTIRETMMSFSFDPKQKDAPNASPLAAMGREVLSALVNPSGTGLPFLWTLQPGTVSPMVTVANTGAIFHVVSREAPAVSPDTAEVKSAEASFKQIESTLGSNLYLKRLIQAAQDSLKQQSASQG